VKLFEDQEDPFLSFCGIGAVAEVALEAHGASMSSLQLNLFGNFL
jgi:hypothetical protein